VAPPQTPLRELTALPRTPQLDLRGLLLRGGRRGEGRGGERKGEGRGGKEGKGGGRGPSARRAQGPKTR